MDSPRILVVEDEYLIAEDVCSMLADAGMDVVGPAPDLRSAMELLKSEARVDGALLDVNLRGEQVYALADALSARNVPFAFTTGYERWVLPERFARSEMIDKPVQPKDLDRLLKRNG